MMLKRFSVWLQVALLPSLIVAAGAVECSQRDKLLRPKLKNNIVTNSCLMDCTETTYVRKLQLQDKHTIRFHDSTQGVNPGEYCWPTELQCIVGETYHSAYLVLPVDISTVGHQQLDVQSTDRGHSRLTEHTSPTTLAGDCGLRYDVTEHFSVQASEMLFCVEVAAEQEGLVDRLLGCPPFLVTFWKRNSVESSQQSGG